MSDEDGQTVTTVGQLIEFLENFGTDMPVVFEDARGDHLIHYTVDVDDRSFNGTPHVVFWRGERTDVYSHD